MDGPPLSPEHCTAEEVVRRFQLEPLDEEGGFFRRTAEAGLVLSGSDRRAYSVIYALFTPVAFSALHRLVGDEIWCCHAGDALESLRLRLDGSGGWVRLGLNVAAGELPQDVVPAHTWQGTQLVAGGRWALVSCITVPEFVWTDFELGRREPLTAVYPDFAEGIRALTRLQPPGGQR